MSRIVHPDDDQVFACPECDGTDLWERSDDTFHGPDLRHDQDYRCQTCGAEFDTPVEREPAGEPPTNARKAAYEALLEDLDPDEDLVADGGRLPDSWDHVAVDRPDELRPGVSPRDLELAVEGEDTLFHVVRRVRGRRAGVSVALNRLDLRGQVKTVDARSGQLRSDGGQLQEYEAELVTGGLNRRLGPHRPPRIKCGNCGTEHHYDAATGEYQGRCRECANFLRRPTDAEHEQFTDFLVWNSRHIDASRTGGGDGV